MWNFTELQTCAALLSMPRARVGCLAWGNPTTPLWYEECVGRRIGGIWPVTIHVRSWPLLNHLETVLRVSQLDEFTVQSATFHESILSGTVSNGILVWTWLQCNRHIASHARIRVLWLKPSWIILLMLAKQPAPLNKPSSDCIYEMLCLPSNEPTLFKHSSRGSFNLPLPDNIFVFHLVLLKIITFTPWSNPCHGVATQVIWGREQHLIKRLAVKENSHIRYIKKGGENPPRSN